MEKHVLVGRADFVDHVASYGYTKIFASTIFTSILHRNYDRETHQPFPLRSDALVYDVVARDGNPGPYLSAPNLRDRLAEVDTHPRFGAKSHEVTVRFLREYDTPDCPERGSR